MAESFDEKVRKEVDKEADDLLRVLREARQSTIRARRPDGQPCPKCGCQHVFYVEIPNYRVALDAAEFLTNRGFGRPTQKPDDEEKQGVTFVRKIVYEGVAPSD